METSKNRASGFYIVWEARVKTSSPAELLKGTVAHEMFELFKNKFVFAEILVNSGLLSASENIVPLHMINKFSNA